MSKKLAASSILGLLAVMIIIVGFSLANENKAYEIKTLVIEKQSGLQDYYKPLKTITEKDSIESFFDILVRATWENAEVSMTRPPDYKINDLYEIWISPQRNVLEVVINGKSKYTKLSEKDSNALFEMMENKQLVN